MTTSFSTGFVPFGASMPKSGLTKFTAKQGDTRIRILSTGESDFLLAKTHYLKGVGSFHCFGGSCCGVCANAPEGEANTSEKAILPIAVATASIAGGVSVDYCYLALTSTKYEQLLSLNTNVGDVTTYDILIQCTDEQWQKYTFLPLVNQQSSLVATQDQINAANNYLAVYRAGIKNQLGKTLDENSFQVARAKSLQQAASGVGVQFTPNPAASQVFAQPQPVQALPTIKPQVVQQPVQTVVAPTVATVQPVVEPTSVVATQPIVEQVAPAPQPIVPEVVVAQPVVEATPIIDSTTVATTTPTVESNTVETEVDWSEFMATGVEQ